MEKYTKLQKIRLNDSYILRCTMMNLLIKQGVHKPLIQTVNSVTHSVHVGAAIVTFDLLYATSGRFITFAERQESRVQIGVNVTAMCEGESLLQVG